MSKKAQKDYKLNIFDMFRAVDRRDFDWLSQQDSDAQAEFNMNSMRWASCLTSGFKAAYMLCLINQRVNHHFFELNDPDLSYRLLASCGTGTTSERVWINNRRATTRQNAAIQFLARFEPFASDDELEMLLRMYDRAAFEELVLSAGMQRSKHCDEVTGLLKAYDKAIGD